MTNKLETLSSLARWKAFVRKYRGFTSNHLDEKVFIKDIPNYKKKWISDGIGTPLARVEDIDIIEALIDFKISVNEINSLDDDDLKLYFRALFSLDYDKSYDE